MRRIDDVAPYALKIAAELERLYGIEVDNPLNVAIRRVRTPHGEGHLIRPISNAGNSPAGNARDRITVTKLSPTNRYGWIFGFGSDDEEPYFVRVSHNPGVFQGRELFFAKPVPIADVKQLYIELHGLRLG